MHIGRAIIGFSYRCNHVVFRSDDCCHELSCISNIINTGIHGVVWGTIIQVRGTLRRKVIPINYGAIFSCSCFCDDDY